MKCNLYQVTDNTYEWGCFVLETSRNKAKLRVAKEFDFDYIDARCKTLKKGIEVQNTTLITDCYDKGYDLVQSLGFEYKGDYEE